MAYFHVDKRVRCLQLDSGKIVGGPAAMELLLGQHDYPREVIPDKDEDPADAGRVRKMRCKFRSVTISKNGMLILVGHMILETRPISGGPQGGIPLLATYDPKKREGTYTANFTGKGVAVIYVLADGETRARFDIGERKKAAIGTTEVGGQ
jgi:hypothetical protein